MPTTTMAFVSAMLFVRDLARMTAFYADALELVAIERTRLETWVEFDGPVGFSLHAIPPDSSSGVDSASDIGSASGTDGACPPRPRDQHVVKLTFEVVDLAQAQARVTALGGALVERPWGAVDGVDPEGNVFGLSERR